MAEDREFPRLDEIEGWPLPEAQAKWLGDPEAEHMLLDGYRSGRMHHAWLIAGPNGIGKATLAYRFARFVLAHPDPAAIDPAQSVFALSESEPNFRKVALGAHPNLLTLRRPFDAKGKRFKTELTVDEVRRLIPFFGGTAGQAGWRIAIVDRADDMNSEAANALLKMLEEPPRNALFLIVADAPGRLLATIRSRCRRLTLEGLKESTIAEALASEGGTIDDRRLAAELASGSLRQAIQLTREEGVELYRSLAAILGGLPKLDIEKAYSLAESVARREDEAHFQMFLDLLRDWLSRRVHGLAEPVLAGGGMGPSVRSLALWAEVWEKLENSSALTEALNLDRKQLVMSILTALSHATRM